MIFLLRLMTITALLGSPLFALDPTKRISQYIRDHWGLEEGLPQASIQSILQTDDGYLWLATQEGLVRFDGVRMTVFQYIDELGVSLGNIADLHEKDGHLWIATRRSVFSYFDGEFTHYDQMPGAPDGRVFDIEETQDGALWFGTDHGLFSFRDNTFTRYTEEDGLPSNTIPSLMCDRSGRLWIGTQNGLVVRDEGEYITYTKEIGLLSDKIEVVYQTSDGIIWIGCDQGLTQLDEGRFQHFTTENGLISPYVRTLYEDSDQILWVGTMSGLNRFYRGSFLPTDDGALNQQVHSLLEDEEGSLWFGTWTEGVYRYRDGIFTCFGMPEGFPHPATRGGIVDRNGELWFGTDQGLVKGIDENLTVYGKAEGLPSDIIYTLLEDRAGAIWVGTRFGGIGKIDTDGTVTRYTTEQGLSDNSIRSIIEDRDGGIWIATHGSGLDFYKDDRFLNISEDDGLASNLLFSVFQDHSGRLWVGTSGQGLSIVETDGSITNYSVDDGLAGNTVYTFRQDGDSGDIWIGTTDGISIYRNGRFFTLTVEDGLFNNIAYAMVEDNYGYIWIACNKGVYSILKKEVYDYLEGRLNKISYRNFDMSDGMRGFECNYGGMSTVVKTKDGALWFPTVRGVARINPISQQLNQRRPPVLIESVTVNGLRTEDLDVKGSFGAYINRLEFGFTALTFLEPEQVSFKYMVDGYDDEWQIGGSKRDAQYTNIPYGNYTFRVIASNSDGIWNDEGASYSFSVAKRYYQTIWFYLLVSLALILTSLGIYRLRVHRLLSREQRLQDEIDLRTRELQEANRNLVRTQQELLRAAHQAGMSEIAANVLHEIGNALNSVNVTASTIDKTVQDLKTDFLERLVMLLNEHKGDLSTFLSQDPRGRQALTALNKVAKSMASNQGKLSERVNDLDLQILRMNDIVRAQMTRAQDYHHYYEEIELNRFLNEIVDQHTSLNDHGRIVIHRDYQPMAPIKAQKAKLKQVLVHLLSNAVEALRESAGGQPTITLRTHVRDDRVVIEIQDNGSGVADQNLKRIFFHGFTTKNNRDGFGLHYCANAVREMQGRLKLESDGPGKGARATITLPVRRNTTYEGPATADPE